MLLVLIVLLIPTFWVPNDWQGWPQYPSTARIVELLGLSESEAEPLQQLSVADSVTPNESSLTPSENIAIEAYQANIQKDSVAIGSSGSEINTKAGQQNYTVQAQTSGAVSIETFGNTQALAAFLNALHRNEHRSLPVGVLHYADSQAENDLLTITIRSLLQAQFGGMGVGLLHPGNHAPNLLGHRCSRGWQFGSVHNGSKTARKYGILGALSSLPDGENDEWVKVDGRAAMHGSARYRRLRLLLGHNTSLYWVRCNINNSPTDSVLIEPNNGIKIAKFDVPNNGKANIRLQLSGEGTLHAYGLIQESETGIYVHNIPIRGSSGTFFAQFDEATARAVLTTLNVRLIIVQYGLNTVPVATSNFGYYEKTMTTQLQTLKRLHPNASIVLVGVSDMSKKTDNGYISHPNVERVRAAQRRAAQKAGVAFWDSYLAMGGNNSMSIWATSNPALGQKDYTHFTPRGARIIAKKLANALLQAHAEWEKNAIHQSSSASQN